MTSNGVIAGSVLYAEEIMYTDTRYINLILPK